jgi:iron complex outermembrane recepter protein
MRAKTKSRLLRAALMTSAGIAGLFGAGQAAAQETESEVIIVTGSHIAGTPEDTALPVDVITADDLLNQASPTALDIIKNLPTSNGVLGDTNQFDSRAQGSEGSGSINLRGLGPQRTLVLLNGRRMVTNPFAQAAAGAVDTNTLPMAAIGRIEVLKDGAAATYGSDAIGGVVNFITRDNLEGAELGGNYSYIDGSDGAYDISALWGVHGETARLVISLGYQHRSELAVLDRDWAHLDFADNPQGGWSAAGSPNTFVPLGIVAPTFVDTDCATLGGLPSFAGATPVCRWQYTLFDNIVEDEDRYQAFVDFNIDVNENTELHVDALYAYTEVPNWHTSPSYALLQTPKASAVTPFVAGFANAFFFVPANNPGYIDYAATHPGALGAGGALYVAGRPYALSGNPLFDFGPSFGERNYEAMRLSIGLNGALTDAIRYDVNSTYGEEEAYRTGRDTVVNRFQRALRGMGGPDCDFNVGVPGVGPCMFFNPFASSMPANAITGAGAGRPGPYDYDPTLNGGANENPDLINWFFPQVWTRDTMTLWTTELVLSGDLGFELGGGAVQWAAGVQHREETYERELDDITNIAINPCINSVDLNDDTCAVATGALGFLGSSSEQTLERDVNAVFGELSIPFNDAFEMQVAARYEDYGDEIGSTFDPKISARFQLSEWFALRGSAGSTFRGPSLTSTTDGNITALQEVLGTFRAVDIFGNPGLEPESANTYNVGAIFDTGRIFATLDYWVFDFENPIIAEPLAGIVATMFPGGLPTNCGDPDYAALEARFTFTGAGCAGAPGTIARVRTNYVNGSPIQTSGIDFQFNADFDNIVGGTLTLGTGATYVIEYQVDPVSIEGFTLAPVQPGFDAAGQLNYQTTVYPLPQLRGNVFAEWSGANHNLRLQVNYIDGYTDQRLAITGNGKEIDAFITADLNYRLDLGSNATFVVGVQNLTDEEPPFARLDLNYDPLTGDPIGRVIRVGLRQSFN